MHRRTPAWMGLLLIASCHESRPPADPASTIAAMRSAMQRSTAVEYDFDIRVSGEQRKEVRRVRGHAILQPWRRNGLLRIDAVRDPLDGENAPGDHYVLTSDGETVTMLSEARRTVFTSPMHRAGLLLLNGRGLTPSRVFLDEWPVSRLATEKRFRTAGTTSFDGAVCDVLRGELPDEHLRTELAIGQADHLPRRLLLRYANGDVDTRITRVQPRHAPGADELRVSAAPDFATREYTVGGPAVGAIAPPFTLDVAGKPVSLASLKGRIVILDFWATWCGPCRSSIPELQKIYAAGDVEVIGATWKEDGDPDKFARELGVTYRHAKGDAIAEAYGVHNSGIPTIFVIDRRGLVADFFLGWMGEETARDLRKSLDRVRSQ